MFDWNDVRSALEPLRCRACGGSHIAYLDDYPLRTRALGVTTNEHGRWVIVVQHEPCNEWGAWDPMMRHERPLEAGTEQTLRCIACEHEWIVTGERRLELVDPVALRLREPGPEELR